MKAKIWAMILLAGMSLSMIPEDAFAHGRKGRGHGCYKSCNKRHKHYYRHGSIRPTPARHAVRHPGRPPMPPLPPHPANLPAPPRPPMPHR